MGIQNQLEHLSKDTLITLIDYLSEYYDGVDEIIATYLALSGEQGFTGEAENHSQLAKQLESLTKSDKFFHYHEAHILNAQGVHLLQGIATLAENNAEQALALLDRLLERHDRLFERVDDSNGYIGDLMHEAAQLWLQVASRVREKKPEARNWVDVVLGYYTHNDYSCFDSIISDSSCLLRKTELRGLAERFERDAQATLRTDITDRYNSSLSHACLGLSQVAKALEDISLYERSVLISSPQPNSFQLEDIIHYALKLERFDRAEYWLQQPEWHTNQELQTSLKNLLLEKQGNIEQLKENLLSEWQDKPRHFTLSAYWSHADKNEQKDITAELLARANELDDPEEVLDMLLFTEQLDAAAEYLITQHERLTDSYYATVLSWLDVFEEAGQTLAVIVCYRLLLLDVLGRGYSKAYRYAARYFNTLLTLDKKKKPDYRELESAGEFIATLQAKHGLKRSFWREAGYPAKGSKA